MRINLTMFHSSSVFFILACYSTFVAADTQKNETQKIYLSSFQFFQEVPLYVPDFTNTEVMEYHINPISYNDVIHPYVISSDFSKEYTVQVNRSTEYIFEYVYNTSHVKRKALRVTVHCPSSISTYPLLVVVRQQKEVLSWQLPLPPPPNSFAVEKYKKISRTLCKEEDKRQLRDSLDATQRLFIDVTTSSPVYLNFSVEVNTLENFIIGLENPQTVVVSPGEPFYYYFKFPVDINVVLCPVFDTEETIRYGNFYQTMTLKAGITVRKEDYPDGFYIVIVTLSNDDECAPYFQHIFMHREKNVKIWVEEKITYLEYLAAIFAGLGFCAIFYIVTLVITCVEYIRAKKEALAHSNLEDESLIDNVDENLHVRTCHGATTSTFNEAADDSALSVCSSLSEKDYDILEDAESEKDVFRAVDSRHILCRSCCSTCCNISKAGKTNYLIYYFQVLDETGNQDLCYYNFWCAHPLGLLSDFNHVFSNIAYVLFGILFIGLCLRKERKHIRASKKDRKVDKYYGIPQHYGIFYAMGGALIMEGLLSACYHICPNHSNFQFDTAFMYVIAVLCMLKIYQTRHPDVNASANGTYLVLAFSVLLGVIGVLSGTIYFWILFAIIHIITCSLLSGHIYYMGRLKVDVLFFKQIPDKIKRALRLWKTTFRPMYLDRMVLLLIANAANWSLAIFGVITTPKDFASYLLVIFLTNLLLYTGFYIIMKLRHGEKILLQPLIYLVFGTISWASSAYFFLAPRTTWEMTPAHSRQYNRDCSLLHFYDTHDIWHFLSASAMFFGFMLLLTLDDDLTFTPRETIPVF
ncbi:SID1 transmembrane family member 1 [Armadillidium nasatum]|uniref:SID1 transmembrane family member 1 n=1 Tax=Armadillidium nasatum TaxID=96803 RepID=A0A5N5TKP1_9CRUS|nr:SID1 transmembrane family member 1 [Armadillidium nasatum]